MNLKLRRTARTPYSEEISIFDADVKGEDDEPVNIGKLDVHYVEDQIVGTLLIWAEYAQNFATAQRGTDMTMTDLIDEILDEVSEPLGVSAEYGIEVYYPRLDQHEFVSNYEDLDDEEILDEFDDDESTNGSEPNGRVH
ncbi:MAG TPA: hypothetical protein VKY74_15850 [Chloroflexia bacterium]|nr:hypothetical protein [Chloroflexia bacterium]